jgi:antitoxin (DNA-binding transcriptional repressor) of toxin-antitoxin stability system
MKAAKVGIREFREKLATYLEGETPVAVTRHGETVGFYVPMRRKPTEADREALRAAGERVDAQLKAAGLTADDILEDFEKIRRSKT